MNTIDIVVTKILVPPHQVITEELCCWEVTVETDCYGAKGRQEFASVIFYQQVTDKKKIIAQIYCWAQLKLQKRWTNYQWLQ